jgi:SAM-dependent methyltransferase
MAMLVIPEREIRRHGPGHVLTVCWRQWRTERALRARGIHFRNTEAAGVAAAYAAMSEAEFAAINGRQDWANWRTIPRALSGRVPDRPLRVLDLGCGTGSSTAVLAFYCPAGSHISGYEFAAPLVEWAQRRVYRHQQGGVARVEFRCQPVTEPFRQADARLVPAASVDLVNASGIVGHHLNVVTLDPLVSELRRVLMPNGVAMLDVGPTLPRRTLIPLMQEAAFRYRGHCKSWWLDPTGQAVFEKT